jgi:hypothetical protein
MTVDPPVESQNYEGSTGDAIEAESFNVRSFRSRTESICASCSYCEIQRLIVIHGTEF